MPSTFSIQLARADRMMTGKALPAARQRFSTDRPSSRGRPRSSTTAWYSSTSPLNHASSPSAAMSTTKPAAPSAMATSWARTGLSSTIRARMAASLADHDLAEGVLCLGPDGRLDVVQPLPLRVLAQGPADLGDGFLAAAEALQVAVLVDEQGVPR